MRELFEILKKENPNPKPSLNFNNDFELLCAVMLSAQTTDKAVNEVTPELFRRAPTPDKMQLLETSEIEAIIARLGLYRNKSKNLKALAGELCKRFDGKVPNTEKDLVSLPGVGVKTARVVQNIAFGKGTVAVDTHIFRVSKRLNLATGKTPEEVSNKLERIIPKEYIKDAHHWLLFLGRNICKARAPMCSSCPVSHLCASKENNKD